MVSGIQEPTDRLNEADDNKSALEQDAPRGYISDNLRFWWNFRLQKETEL